MRSSSSRPCSTTARTSSTARQLQHLGFAGFRVHYPVNTQKYKDEVLVFLGASYLRALGKGQLYGISARGLAVDTALNSGEEFPQFTEFWLQRPQARDKELTIYALLDSPRVSGAYRFVLKPGETTAIEVKSQLYLRENVTILGIAPLTSMYFFGENQRSAVEDYRPEVHDSDGLSVQSGTGEWIWRPLVNPKRLLVTSYALTNPQGFGMMQRDRAFASYQDLEAHYEMRPSVWIEPIGNWGAGRIELVQLPTPDETNDNAVAFWVPEVMPTPGKPYQIEYRMLWQKDSETRPPLSWVTQTRRGHGYLRKVDDSVALVVDFEGPALARLAPDTKLEAIVSSDANGKLLETNTYRNDVSGGWRMTVRAAPQRRRQAGRVARLPAPRQRHPIRNLELHITAQLTRAPGHASGRPVGALRRVPGSTAADGGAAASAAARRRGQWRQPATGDARSCTRRWPGRMRRTATPPMPRSPPACGWRRGARR